jgi:predicted transcriptional regulator
MAEQTITRTFAMDEETAKRLEAMAAAQDRSQSYIIRKLVNQEFERAPSAVSKTGETTK